MQKKTAFTFIEVMVAIVVFSIGILAVLKLVTNNLETMDKNNVRVQATLLAKEGIELVYNMRDTNIKKELSWNCVMNREMYTWSADDLSSAIGWGNQSNFEDVICDGYFGVTGYLQIAFDSDIYVYTKLIQPLNTSDGNFLQLYDANKLYLYTGSIGDKSISWYAYTGSSKGNNTYFARYISFDYVKEGEAKLPMSKLMKVTSHVLYMKGGNKGEVVFESFIGNY